MPCGAGAAAAALQFSAHPSVREQPWPATAPLARHWPSSPMETYTCALPPDPIPGLRLAPLERPSPPFPPPPCWPPPSAAAAQCLHGPGQQRCGAAYIHPAARGQGQSMPHNVRRVQASLAHHAVHAVPTGQLRTGGRAQRDLPPPWPSGVAAGTVRVRATTCCMAHRNHTWPIRLGGLNLSAGAPVRERIWSWLGRSAPGAAPLRTHTAPSPPCAFKQDVLEPAGLANIAIHTLTLYFMQ